jgi:hypothetical protein
VVVGGRQVAQEEEEEEGGRRQEDDDDDNRELELKLQQHTLVRSSRREVRGSPSVMPSIYEEHEGISSQLWFLFRAGE